MRKNTEAHVIIKTASGWETTKAVKSGGGEAKTFVQTDRREVHVSYDPDDGDSVAIALDIINGARDSYDVVSLSTDEARKVARAIMFMVDGVHGYGGH